MTDIAILGGGAAGAAVFGALIAKGAEDRVHWVAGDAGPVGRGVAYSTRDTHHLLNVRANGMGLYLDADEDFVTFSTRHLPHVQPTDFLPRYMFGQYIDSQLRERMARAEQQGRSDTIYAQQATYIHATPRGYHVGLNDETRITVQKIVLALGAMDPRPLSAVSSGALESGAYVLDPWSLMHRASSPRRITVIGTGLTAVDTLISVSKRWPEAELVAVSRHGLLPFTHPVLPIAPFYHQSELNSALLKCNGPAEAITTIRRVFQAHQTIDWRSVIDGMRPINSQLWQRFNARQRRQFLRHVRWLWESARHRLAPESADSIQQLREEGRLQIHSARVISVDGNGPLAVTIRSRATQRIAQLESDIVVQATGLDTAVAFAKSPLLAGLLRSGLAGADPLELGLHAYADGQIINANGRAQDGLYAIGSLLKGNLWECTAMPEIRGAADALATRLSNDRRHTETPASVFQTNATLPQTLAEV
jgi:uncharacterized NAD(P)/FAD-binding protein YdhS